MALVVKAELMEAEAVVATAIIQRQKVEPVAHMAVAAEAQGVDLAAQKELTAELVVREYHPVVKQMVILAMPEQTQSGNV